MKYIFLLFFYVIIGNSYASMCVCCVKPDTSFLNNLSVLSLEDEFKEGLKKTHLKYTPSEQVEILYIMEDFKSLPQFYHTLLGAMGPVFQFKDGNCVTFLVMGRKSDWMDENDIVWENTVKLDLVISLNLDEYFINLPSEVVTQNTECCDNLILETFHADDGIDYAIQLDGQALHNKFRYCHVLLLSKDNTRFFKLYNFYTEDGYVNKKNYEDYLGNMFHFMD